MTFLPVALPAKPGTMKWTFTWTIPPQELSAIKAFYAEWAGSPMVQRRKQRNVDHNGVTFSRDNFVKAMLYFLCTSQQPSGPTSRVNLFFQQQPFPITEQYCEIHQTGLVEQLGNQLAQAGMRFHNQIPASFAENATKLNTTNWELFRTLHNYVQQGIADEIWEREMARSISRRKKPHTYKLKGLGPKQACNLLKLLGISRFEIPVDSRVVKWLATYGFPYSLADSSLQDPVVYEMVVDAIKELSAKWVRCLVCSMPPFSRI